MRNINEIIIHCADTRTDQDFSVDDIRSWHKQRGFNDIGYHYYIRLDGKVYKGRDLNVIGAHCIGHNRNSIGVCFEGGKLPNGNKWDEPMIEQSIAFNELKTALNIALCKKLKISAHYEYSTKTCPNFNVDIFK